ncbi:anillin isoform X2 [Ixodes scapularis]|uniref:anillin isoform X2 n=1 Tax=Ixodes scapularis TaxID=6945 RepID=UPI001C3929A4|nr:anillin isoform X2 [Ixodes scapularis]
MLHTSLLSSKRKRDDPAAPLQDHGTAMESPSKDPSKRLCSPKMVQDLPDEDKENAPAPVPHKATRGIAVDSPMEIQNEDAKVGLSKADDARTAPVSVFKEPSAVKKSALLDAHRPEQKPSKVDTLPSTVSVAARAALFETAIGTVTGTMPAPKRIPVRPTLKQAFSTVDVAPASAKKLMSSVGSSPSTPLSNPPCTPDEMETPPPAVKSAATRPGTPRRPELPQMAIKTIPGTPRPQSANDVHQTDVGGADLKKCVEKITGTSEDDQHQPIATEEKEKIQTDFEAGLPSGGTGVPPSQVFKAPPTPEAVEKPRDKAFPATPPVQEKKQHQVAEFVQADLKGCVLQGKDSVQSTKTGRTSSISKALFVEHCNGEPAPMSPLIQEKVNLHVAEIKRLETDRAVPEDNQAPSTLQEIPRDLVAARQQMFSEELLDETDLMSPEETAIFDEMDDILDEYSDGSSQADLVSLNSCTSSPAKSESRFPLTDAGKKPSPQDDSAKSDVTPKRELHRTISLFRRRMEQCATPKRTSTGWGFSPKPSTSDAPMPGPEALMSLGDRIRALQEEVKAQQTIISQASQALNLCQASAEFVGSPEQTEAERLLLIATQRRLACINEMQRLKASGDVLESNTPRGTLVLSELWIPAKPEMLAASKELEKNNEIIYFMFLAQYRSKVYASPLLSNEDLTEKQQSFLFREPVTISNMNEDFQVSVEVYALKTTKGVIPHDKKYHIKKVSSCSQGPAKAAQTYFFVWFQESLRIKLSSKGKKTDSVFLSPVVSSPGGPDAVRTSSFQKLGSFVLNSLTCGQKVFALSKVPNSFHLEDKVAVKIQLHAEHNVEHHGFLTLFEEVGGYGAWTRLWCVLKGSHILCWRYPDEETTKAPLDSIDLRQCISAAPERLSIVECARPHTFKLVVVQALEVCKGDSLTTTRHSTLATTKHLFSADSKEELQEWCAKFSAALTCIRRWNPKAYKAMDIGQLL